MERKRTMSKDKDQKKIADGSGNAILLHEIESISKAMSLDKTTSWNVVSSPNSRFKVTGKSQFPDPKSKLDASTEDIQLKEKKSIWNWKPLKALSTVRNCTFNCCFSLQVQSIEGLPRGFHDVSLCVFWKRRDGVLVTRSAKVHEGIAVFEQSLVYSCSVYVSRSGPHHTAKYQAKHFLLYASVVGAPELDLGRHRVDLTRLLPLTVQELEDEKSSGKWTTSFRLSGKAKGALMHVSFGYLVVGDNSNLDRNHNNASNMLSLKQDGKRLKRENKFRQVDERSSVQRLGSLPALLSQCTSTSANSVENVKELREVLPTTRSELASSLDILYEKLDESTFDDPTEHDIEFDAFKENYEPVNSKDFESDGFSVTDQGIELSSEEKSEKLVIESAELSFTDKVPTIKTDTDKKLISQNSSNDELVIGESDWVCAMEIFLKEIESALNNVSHFESTALESPDEENDRDVTSEHNTSRLQKSNSLDDVTESVASEFLSKLGIEHSPFGLSSESEPESPRERLLREFEKDALAEGFSLFDLDMDDENEILDDFNTSASPGSENYSEDFQPSDLPQDVMAEHLFPEAASSKISAKMLEDLETEALMREWGLSKKAFHQSPPKGFTGFGSPIDLPPQEPIELPVLGEGLGPFLQTKDGGLLRSMNPSIFRNAKAGGTLVMQVSKPVVVPAEMGSGVMDILQSLAAVGIEKLSVQAKKLMPLEDITGKTMQQVAREATTGFEGPHRQCLPQQNTAIVQDIKEARKGGRTSGRTSNRIGSSVVGSEMELEYVSLKDLAHFAMNKIEALSVEGLRLQSGMTSEEATSNIYAQSISNISSLKCKGTDIGGSLGVDGAVGIQLVDVKDSTTDVDGILNLSLTLDEWMKLDSLDIDDVDKMSERTSKILAAHHANSFESIRGRSKGEKRRGKGAGRICGLFGNNFTVALMVQLRDLLRNYEPVGTPMLALVQVERVFIPPKPRMYHTVSDAPNGGVEDDESEQVVMLDMKDKTKETTSEKGGIAKFKITEVHVAGPETEENKKKLWGTSSQQQSGSRWLIANGMGKGNKYPSMKPKALPQPSMSVTTKVERVGIMWSISSPSHTECRFPK